MEVADKYTQVHLHMVAGGQQFEFEIVYFASARMITPGSLTKLFFQFFCRATSLIQIQSCHSSQRVSFWLIQRLEIDFLNLFRCLSSLIILQANKSFGKMFPYGMPL